MAYKSYREVRDAYDRLADAGIVSESLPDWSRDMNRVTGTSDYDEGLSDNWIKRSSSWIDELIESTGVPHYTGKFGEWVGGAVGAPEMGKEIGAGFGRMGVNMLPMFLPGPGWAMTAARLGGMAALSGAEAYTKTGSVASGVTAGLLNAAMPGISNLAEQAVLKRVGGKLVEGPIVRDGVTQAFKKYYAQSLPQGLAAYTGGQVAGAGVGVASDVGQQVLSGDEVHISPTEQLLNLTLGQLPFAAMHLTKGGRVPFGGAATRAEIAKVEGAIQTSKNTIELQQMQDALQESRNKSTLEDVPDYQLDIKPPSPTDVARKNFLINQLRQKQRDAKTEGTPLSLDEWHKDVDEVNKLVRETGLVDGNIRGAKVDDKTERFQLIAKEVIHRPETGWRMVIAADDPRNGEYAGKKVDWSTLYEPEAQPSDVEGHMVYSVPKGYHDTKPPSPGWIDRQSRRVEGAPELPIQPNEIVDANSEIRQIEQQVRSAKDDDDFKAAILKLNTVRQAYGWRPIDDVEIGARQTMWKLGSEKDAFRNALEQTRREVQARDSARVETELERQRRSAKEELDRATDSQDLTAQAVAQKKVEEIDSQMVDLSPKAKRERENATFETILKESKEGPEKVVGTAIRLPDGKIVSREKTQHFELADELSASGVDVSGLKDEDLGFVTSTGRFVNRYEAAEISKTFADKLHGVDVTEMVGARERGEELMPGERITYKGPMGNEVGAFLNYEGKGARVSIGGRNVTVPLERLERPAVSRSELAQNVVALYNDFNRSSGRRHEIVTGGLWEKKLHEWKEEGSGDIEQLKAKFAEAIASGMGLKGRIQKAETYEPTVKPPPEKVHPVVEKAIEAPVKPETVPIKQTVYEDALKVTEGTEFVNDREMFLDFVQLGGRKPFQAKYKMDEDAYNDWTSQDHVREWTLDMADIAEGNAAPNSINRPKKRSKEFVPVSALDKDFVSSVGTTGESLHKRLTASRDPVISQLAADLGKFGEALKRVSVKVKDGLSGSRAVYLPDSRVQIELNSGIIKSSANSQDYTLMHELLHGLSQQELWNPLNAKHVAKFSDLRNRMVELLPKNLRDVFNEVTAANWYERYAKGQSEWKELSDLVKTNNEAHLVYGLLNDAEFLAQGFTAEPLRLYLKSHKAADGKTFLHKFTNWISELIGLKIKGTAFEEFLSHSDKILDSGNYVASIHNYGERYFTGKGYSSEWARELTSNGVGLLKDAKYTSLTPDYIVDRLHVNLFSNESQAMEAGVRELMKTEPTATANLLAENAYEPNDIGVDALASDLVKGKVDPTILDLLDPKAADYVYSRAREVESVTDMLRAATDASNKGLINLNADDTRAPILAALKNAQKITDIERKFALTTGQIQSLVKVSPAGYMADIVANPAPQGLYVDPTDSPQRQLSIFDKIFGTPAKFSKDSPEFAELTAKAHQLLSNKHQMETTALRPLVSKIDPVTGEETIYDKKGKELSDPTVEKAVNKWMYQNQEQGKETGVVMLGRDNTEIQRILATVPENRRQAVIDKVEGQVRSIQIAQKQTLEKMTDVSVIDAAALIAPSTGQSATKNVKIADAMYRALSMDFSDPQQAQQAQVLLDNVQRTVGDVGTFNTLMQFLQNQKEIIKVHEEHFAANPAWATAQRFGKFELEYRKGGKVYFDKVNSRKEAEQKVADFGGQIVRFEPTAETDDTAAAIFNNRDTPRQLVRLRELEANKYEILSHIYEPEVIDDMRRNSAVEQYAVEAAYAGGVKGLKVHPRRLSKGAEEISWLNNHVNWIGQNASHWTREKFKAQSRLILSQPGLQNRPDLLNAARQYVSQMLRADPEAGKIATRVTSTWLLGYNPASAIVNSTQLMTRGIAEFTNITGKPLQSYKRVLNAYKEMMGVAQGKGWAGPDHEWVVKQMKEEGIMAASMFDEGAMQQEKTATNLKRAIAKNRPQTLGQFLGTLAGQYSNVGMMAFKAMERVNNTGAVLSAFDIYRERGLSKEAAYAKALEVNRTINDVGGKANRPIGLFSGTDQFSRSAAMVGTSMQSYTLGSMWQLGSYLKRGAFGGSSLTPNERWNARKAAVQMLATQFAAAGALGLPAASSAIAILEQMFPNLEPGKNLREMVHGLISQFITEDEDNGKVLTDIAMTGIPSMLGWDWHSRLSMGQLPGVSEINGFQPGLLPFGAPGSVVTQFVKGVGGLAAGDKAKAMNMFPPGVKKVVDLASAGFKARDYNGKPILDVTPGETVGVALGFTPKRVKDFKTAQSMAARSKEVQDAEKQKFTKSLVDLVEDGNFDAVKHQLNERARTDPTFEPEAGARQVARAAVEMAFPNDLRRSSKDSAMLQTFNIPQSMPSEMARKQYEVMVLQSLGVSMRPRDLQKAAIMDQLRAQNPNASRYELSREAERIQGKLKQQQMLPEPAI